MNTNRISELLGQYLSGSLSLQDLHELINELKLDTGSEELQKAIDHLLANPPAKAINSQPPPDIIFQQIMQKAADSESRKQVIHSMPAVAAGKSRIMLLRTMAAAAVLIGLCCGGYYFLGKNLTTRNSNGTTNKFLAIKNDVAPGGNKATLTLANGSTVILDQSLKGTLAQQGTTNILQLKNGQLTYQASAKEPAGVFYNTVTTPRGGQYELILPDGSKVWLNASSSLRFPTAFTGKQRAVELTGEAYFEIEKNKQLPFAVQVDGMKVEVLGTHFDIMAYKDENAINTTLLEGSVKISTANSHALLQPGQQAALTKTSPAIRIREADVEQVIAWKNGLFQFNSDDIETIMRQLGRWYDVETAYEGKIPAWHFTGAIARDIPLSNVLKMLEVNEVRFRMEGRKIVVL